ncbi:MAG: DUF1015 domain-containing protein [Ruminococcaceae bacterium]|nr:DUF1015 domain-containing protein [Oscillospiraceae bacterium]
MSSLKKADILVPAKGVDLTKWSVVACDQYTSQPEYWQRVEKLVGGEPSTLNLVYPEAFLSEGDERIEKINSAMKKYEEDGVFEELLGSLIYVERTMENGKTRKGIVGCVDLEDYDFSKGSKSKIRATEGTVLERIPPRVKIRENAGLELPHVMLLMNDSEKTVIECIEKGELIYDFDLMENGGHLKGYLLSDFEAERVLAAIDELEENAEDNLVFAVGDGNHSLATAKTCWENIKKNIPVEEQENHPARYCLVELENIHDDALEFEPIHRVVFGSDADKLMDGLLKYYPESSTEDNGGQHLRLVKGDEIKDLYIVNDKSNLAVGSLQNYLDHIGAEVDYIHGDDVVCKLSAQDGNVGFLLDGMEKSDLFTTVIKDGALPRKTFSMGHAWDKRYYFEAKKIK